MNVKYVIQICDTFASCLVTTLFLKGSYCTNSPSYVTGCLWDLDAIWWITQNSGIGERDTVDLILYKLRNYSGNIACYVPSLGTLVNEATL